MDLLIENEMNVNDEFSSFIYSFKENTFNSFSNILFITDDNSNKTKDENNKENLGNKENKEDNIIPYKKRQRGRKNKEIDEKIIKMKTHDKFQSDNILRKIQVHYMNFIVTFINEILKELGFNQRFYKLEYRFKCNVTKNNIIRFRNCTIGDILSNNISDKYIKTCKEFNIILINELRHHPIINSILSENYLHLFKNVYYKSDRIINLIYYGLDKKITLSKNIKMYKDLLNNHNALFNKDKFYIIRLNQCVTRNFLLDSIFLCN